MFDLSTDEFFRVSWVAEEKCGLLFRDVFSSYKPWFHFLQFLTLKANLDNLENVDPSFCSSFWFIVVLRLKFQLGSTTER